MNTGIDETQEEAVVVFTEPKITKLAYELNSKKVSIDLNESRQDEDGSVLKVLAFIGASPSQLAVLKDSDGIVYIVGAHHFAALKLVK